MLPPGRRNGPPEARTADATPTTRSLKNNRQRTRNAWRRRPWLDCGCSGDTCHCTTPPLSDYQLDGWADCARYIMDTSGCIPLLPIEVLRALYRRGGDDRVLAEQLHAAGGGVVA